MKALGRKAGLEGKAGLKTRLYVLYDRKNPDVEADLQVNTVFVEADLQVNTVFVEADLQVRLERS